MAKTHVLLMPVTHFSGSQSKQHRFTLPGIGLNMRKLELNKYQNGEDGKYSAKRWEVVKRKESYS